MVLLFSCPFKNFFLLVISFENPNKRLDVIAMLQFQTDMKLLFWVVGFLKTKQKQRNGTLNLKMVSWWTQRSATVIIIILLYLLLIIIFVGKLNKNKTFP